MSREQNQALAEHSFRASVSAPARRSRPPLAPFAGLPLRLRYLHDVIGTVAGAIGFAAADSGARMLARGVFDLDQGPRRTIERHLRLALGYSARPEQITDLARTVFENVATFWVELLYLHRLLRGSNWRRRVEVPQQQEWEALAASGRPVVLVTGYFGNPVVGICTLARMIPPIHVVVDPMAMGLVEASRRRVDLPDGLNLLPVRFARTALPGTLRRGGRVVLLIGQTPRAGGTLCDFLGSRHRHHATSARLAIRTGCEIVPFACSRTGRKFSFHLEMLDRIQPAAQTAAMLTARCLSTIEQAVRQAPGQFLWSRV